MRGLRAQIRWARVPNSEVLLDRDTIRSKNMVQRRRNSVRIIGVGATAFGKFGDRSSTSLAAEAARMAVLDAGVSKTDIDGLVNHIGSPRGSDYDSLARALGLEVGYAFQPWSHGRFMSASVTNAVDAVEFGRADTVLVICAFKGRTAARIGEVGNPYFSEIFREGGGPHEEQPEAGLVAPTMATAMVWRKYEHHYKPRADSLERVARSTRKSASGNWRAALRAPMESRDYSSAPLVADPLRKTDCSIPVDGAVAFVVSKRTACPAESWARSISILGSSSVRAGRNEYIFGARSFGMWQQDLELKYVGRHPIYEQVQISPGDVGLFYTYDAFTPLSIFALQEFGFSPRGDTDDSVEIIEKENVGPAVNPNGGLLSEGHMNGWGHLADACERLRRATQVDESAASQPRDLALWGSLAGDALVLGPPE